MGTNKLPASNYICCQSLHFHLLLPFCFDVAEYVEYAQSMLDPFSFSSPDHDFDLLDVFLRKSSFEEMFGSQAFVYEDKYATE